MGWPTMQPEATAFSRTPRTRLFQQTTSVPPIIGWTSYSPISSPDGRANAHASHAEGHGRGVLSAGRAARRLALGQLDHQVEQHLGAGNEVGRLGVLLDVVA